LLLVYFGIGLSKQRKRRRKFDSEGDISMAFQVGDRVYVNDPGSYLYKQPATIDVAINGKYTLSLDSGVTANGYTDIDIVYYRVFKQGDRVQTVSDRVACTNTKKGDRGTVMKVLSDCYQVAMDHYSSGGLSSYLFDEVDIERVTLGNQLVNTQNLTVNGNIGVTTSRSGTLYGVAELQTAMNKVGDAMSSTCKHNWQTYTGLAKRMEICTLCPATKNERGIYD
jgi:hypothetical protein